jgi:hypothetical protein
VPLVVELRDAFAHGTVISFTEKTRNAYDTPTALAMILLLIAGIGIVSKPAAGHTLLPYCNF